MIEKRRSLVFLFLPGLFLSGLLLLSGCSQDDVSGIPAGSRVIGFRAQGGMSSLKATTTSKEYIQSFVVNARYNASDDWADAASKFLLQGVTVYRGEDNNWAYSPQAYFPTESGGSVDFFAYSPSGSENIQTGLAAAATAEQEISYKVPVPTGASTVQEDLLVSRTKVEYGDYDKTVKLQFRHALSRILVRAKSGLTAPVTITGLRLRNLYSEGTLKLSDIDASSGWLYSGNVASTTDYVKWDVDESSTRVDYPYFLPEAGVSVGADYKYVVGVDQGIFVLPQTTYGNPADGAPKDDVDKDGGEFGLEISYTLNGASDQAFIQFADINEIAATGVTFENGRQYVLNLSFGSGSNPNPDPNDPDSPSIVVGADISFGILGVEDYPETDIAVYPPLPPDPNKKTWAASNIYWDDTNGRLTFAESDTDLEGYQGVYFKWGSLIGVSAGVIDPFDASDYLFYPNLADGSYSKVQVSAVPVDAPYLITSGSWTGGGTPATDWPLIAYANINVVPDPGVYDSNDTSLTDIVLDDSEGNYKDYTGDICQYLSGYKTKSGLIYDWVMPTGKNFGEPTAGNVYAGSDYTWIAGSATPSGVYGQDEISPGVIFTYAVNSPVFFPASGVRSYSNGSLLDVGDRGYYWSSSVGPGGAFFLNFYSDSMLTGYGFDRTFGQSVRCVRL